MNIWERQTVAPIFVVHWSNAQMLRLGLLPQDSCVFPSLNP